MKDKCEICGETFNLEVVYECACSDNSLNATLCKKCREKYFYNMKHGLGHHYLPVLTYAENLVRHYKLEHKVKDLEKEDSVMQVTYNGFTGELVKLEQFDITYPAPSTKKHVYGISIYDSDKQATHSFANVKLEDVKFMGGAVLFGG